MEWTLSRPETLQVLNSMGIELPADTKLLDDILDKRLRDALNAVQYKDHLPSPFDLRTHPLADAGTRQGTVAVRGGSARQP